MSPDCLNLHRIDPRLAARDAAGKYSAAIAEWLAARYTHADVVSAWRRRADRACIVLGWESAGGEAVYGRELHAILRDRGIARDLDNRAFARADLEPLPYWASEYERAGWCQIDPGHRGALMPAADQAARWLTETGMPGESRVCRWCGLRQWRRRYLCVETLWSEDRPDAREERMIEAAIAAGHVQRGAVVLPVSGEGQQ